MLPGRFTDGALYKAIEDFFGEGLHFYDAAAPIVRADSLDMGKVFRASRYERGSDYLNCYDEGRLFYLRA